MNKVLLFSLFIVFLLPLQACDGAGGDDDDAVDDDDDSTLEPYEQPAPFPDMTREQKREFMERLFFGEVYELFLEFDAEAYEDMTCETCHGEDREDVEHELPNGLEPLEFSDFPFSQSSDPEEAAYGDFMENTLYPAVLDLLDYDSFNSGGPNEFSCYDCHEQG